MVHDEKIKDELAAEPKLVQNADLPSVSVSVDKLKLSLTDRVLVTPEILKSLPDVSLLKPMPIKQWMKKSEYSPYNLRSRSKTQTVKESISSEDVGTYSESTELYWMPEEEEHQVSDKDDRFKTKNVHKKANFCYQVHGI